MFINPKNGGYSVSRTKEQPVVHIKPPMIAENSTEYGLNKDGEQYIGHRLAVQETVTDCQNGLFCVRRVLWNKDDCTRTLRLIFEAETLFQPEKYLIPCVSYNGNAFGEGKEPKGLSCGGEMWLHAYDRVSIPSCTLSEDEQNVFALFVSDETKESLESCCGMAKTAHGMRHRILWPVNETPCTYADNDIMAAPLIQEFCLLSGEKIEVSVYLFVGVPKWKNFGFATLFDCVYHLFRREINTFRCSAELWRLGITYLNGLIEYHNRRYIR